MHASTIDWSEFWIEHEGNRRTAETFGRTFLPELLRVVETHASHARAFLEWGTGMSTLLLARVAAARAGTVTTIDHLPDYARAVVARLPAGAPVRSLTADITGPKLSQEDAGLNYATLPLSIDHEFDCVLVDGRRRIECLLTAFALSHPATVVLLHDYRRNRYRAARLLFDTIEAGEQFLVLRARPDLFRRTIAERSDLLQALRDPPT